MDESERKAGWDTREQYTEQLHNYNTEANNYRFLIQQRRDLVKNVRAYYSVLDAIWSEIKPFLYSKKPGRPRKTARPPASIKRYSLNWFDKRFKELKTFIQAFIEANTNEILQSKNRIIFPKILEIRLREVHDALNKVRFDNGLTIPHQSDSMRLEDMI